LRAAGHSVGAQHVADGVPLGIEPPDEHAFRIPLSGAVESDHKIARRAHRHGLGTGPRALRLGRSAVDEHLVAQRSDRQKAPIL
jgi:hypothetical protein